MLIENEETPVEKVEAEAPIEGEGNTPSALGEDVEQVIPEENANEDWTSEFEKKGPEGLVKESRRMREKIARLEAEGKAREVATAPIKPEASPEPTKPADEKQFDPIMFVSRSERGKTAIAHFKRMGMDDDGIRAIIDTIGILSTDIAGASVEPIASEFREGKFSKAIDGFSKDEKYKFGMSKPEIRKDVESYIRTKYDPKDWTSPEVLESAYGLALARHPEIFTAGQREIVADGDLHGKADNGASTENSAAIAAFAKQNGMDYDTKENRQIARSAYTAYSATMKKGA